MHVAAASDATADATGNVPGTRSFGVMIYSGLSYEIFLDRVKRLEELGFDAIYLPDHIGDLRNLERDWYVTDSLLPILATATERVRIGTLVSNPILRAPALLAKQAIAVQQMSGGRLDLGIGAGLFEWDHLATGTEPWSPKERAGRLTDYVRIVHGILHGREPFVTVEGEWLFARGVPNSPRLATPPRLIIGGQGPTVLRLAAQYGDVWNTIGPMGEGREVVLQRTAEQNERIDRMAEEAGRDPKAVIRSIAAFGEWDPFEAEVTTEEWVETFAGIGMTDFVVGAPDDERAFAAFEERISRELPPLRG